MNNPNWWNAKHDTAWDRVKSAMKRDWEQTKADFSKKHGEELNQGAGDTVKQAAGKEPIPPGNMPNPSSKKTESWDDVEPAYRYGVGAREQYGAQSPSWDSRIESKLSEEWKDMKSGRTWDEVKGRVHSAWDRFEGGKK